MALHNTVRNGFRCPAVVLTVAGSWWFTPIAVNAGLLIPGNILVSHTDGNRLYEYTRDGQLIQSFAVPYPVTPKPVTEYVRDVIVTSDGQARIYNGTADAYVSTLNPSSDSWEHQTHPGWSTVNNVTYGGITAKDNYVFVTDMSTGHGDDLQQGIIRFDITTAATTRFATNVQPIDLNIGLDGMLYALQPDGFPEGFHVEVYDPITLDFVRFLNFFPQPHRAIAVNALGQIYLVDSVGNLQLRAPDGTLINQTSVCGVLPTSPPGLCFLSDIDVAPDGKLVMGTARGRVLTANADLSGLQLLSPSFSSGVFVSFVPEPSSFMMLGFFVVIVTALILPSKRVARR